MEILKKITRLLILAGLGLAFATCASAQVTWTLSDVTFSNGDAITGSFTTNASTNAITSFSITMTGPDNFTIAQMVDSYLPGEIGMANSTFSQYIDLFPMSNLTSAGGAIDLNDGDGSHPTDSLDCATPSCSTLVVSGGHDPDIIGTTPEPATGALMLLGLGLALVMSKPIARWGRRAVETNRA